MSIKAIIPVRSGSTRVVNKNIRPFANSSLLEIKIKQMMRLKRIDGVIVNSNSDEMLDIARNLGAQTVKRDEYYASNEVSINDVYVDIATNCDADEILYVDCTNPLVEDKTINDALDFYYSNKDKYDSLNSAHLIKEFMWLGNKPINYDLSKTPKSQDLPNILALNFAINISPKNAIIENRHIVGKKPFLYQIDDIEAIDVDYEIDFEFAEFLYKKYRMKNY